MTLRLDSPPPVCVPDLHAFPEFLQAVLDQFPGRQLVLLGDLVDRGPDTPGLLSLLKPLVESGRAIALMGNHDHLFCQVLLDGLIAPAWEHRYAGPTIRQYASRAAAEDDARWMRANLHQWHVWRHVYFAHAGPHRIPEPDRQFPVHLWARPGDERPSLPPGCTLGVHGHTITLSLRDDRQPLPVILNEPDGSTSLYLDTGAFHTDVLTVLDLADNTFHALGGHRRPVCT